MLDINKPVQTRDGRKARIIATDKKGNYPIIALIDEDETIISCTKKGNRFIKCENKMDLINVPKKRYLYINVYKNDLCVHKSQLEAQKNKDNDLVAKMKIEINETRQDW